MMEECELTRKKLFLLIQALLCITLAVWLAATAISIYRDGTAWIADGHPLDWIYSREIVAERLAPIVPLFAVSVLFTLIGLILGIQDEESGKPVKDTEITRDLTVSRVADASEAMLAEQRKQKIIRICGWAGFAACMLPIVLYLSNGNNLPLGDLEPIFAALISHIVPWIAAGLICLMVMTALLESSMARETEAAKAQLREEQQAGQRPVKAAPAPAGDDRVRTVVQVLLFAAAVIFIIAGVLTGNAREVLVKAINICTECVGLG